MRNCVYGLIKVFKKRGKENGKHKLALLVLVDGCDWLREWAKYLFWNEMIRYWDRRFRKKKKDYLFPQILRDEAVARLYELGKVLNLNSALLLSDNFLFIIIFLFIVKIVRMNLCSWPEWSRSLQENAHNFIVKIHCAYYSHSVAGGPWIVYCSWKLMLLFGYNAGEWC